MRRSMLSMILLLSPLFIGFSCVPAAQKAATKGTQEAKGSVSSYSLTDYARECAQALGPIPSFSCSPIDEIAVWTKTSANEFIRVGYKDIPGERVAFKQGMGCFNPSLSGPTDYRCAPHARIGAWADTADKDVTWIVDCRRANHVLPAEDPRFESVGVIGHRKSTGQTCFLETKRFLKDSSGMAVQANVEDLKNSSFFEPVSGENMPVPGEPGSEKYWMSPADMGSNNLTRCVRCHAAYPFIRNSTILHREVAKTLGATAPAAYMNGSSGIPRNFESIAKAKSVPYIVVGREGLESASTKGTWTPKHIEFGKNSCTSCHRIGGGYFQVRQGAQASGYCQDKLASADVHCKGMHADLAGTDLINWHKSIFAQKNFPNVDDGHGHYEGSAGKTRTDLVALFKACFLDIKANPEACPLGLVPPLPELRTDQSETSTVD